MGHFWPVSGDLGPFLAYIGGFGHRSGLFSDSLRGLGLDLAHFLPILGFGDWI